jgi:hypothetical protein
MKLTIGMSSIRDGEYEAEYRGGEDITTKNGRRYRMKMILIGGDHAGKAATRLVDPDATLPNTEIAKLFAALAGLPAECGTEVNDADYIGCRYRILVKVSKSGYPEIEKILHRLDPDGTSEIETDADQIF